ncbi:MAG TPA: hypothetical protein EYQ26_00085 [Rhodospirillales bacterium]|jgi:hypothetical protein|nr:hypothetical protein [Rhodospirillales bacterium]
MFGLLYLIILIGWLSLLPGTVEAIDIARVVDENSPMDTRRLYPDAVLKTALEKTTKNTALLKLSVLLKVCPASDLCASCCTGRV